MDVVINFWAVVGAAIVSFVVGGIWFGPLFGKQWMRTVGITHEQMEKAKEKGMQAMWKSYAIMGLGSLVMAYVLAHIIAYASTYSHTSGPDAGIAAAVSVWVGFVAPVTMGSVLWEGRPWMHWFITAGYYLVSLILMGIVITLSS